MVDNSQHPLQDFVIQSFKEKKAHDLASLTFALAGGHFGDETARKSYRLVAKDILGTMESNGLIAKDDMGWYRLV